MIPCSSRPARAMTWTRWPALGAILLLGAGQQFGGTPPPRRHVIEIGGMAFRPTSLVVAPGDTVVWINRDLVPHTATAEAARGWDTGVLAQERSGRVVVGRPGEVKYLCALHPGMRGTLIIRSPRSPSPEARPHDP